MDSHALDCFRRAGRIVKECRDWAAENIRPGVEVRHILETVESMIRERGGEPGFPPSPAATTWPPITAAHLGIPCATKKAIA